MNYSTEIPKEQQPKIPWAAGIKRVFATPQTKGALVLVPPAIVGAVFLLLTSANCTPTFDSQLTGAHLRTLADARGVAIGAAATFEPFQSEPRYIETLKREFNAISAENFLRIREVHPAESSYNFEKVDKLADFAEANKMSAYGFLMWWKPRSIPFWFVESVVKRHSGNRLSSFTKEEISRIMMDHDWTEAERDELIGILRDYITTVVGRYKGRFVAWNVMNEVIADDPTVSGSVKTLLRDTVWLRVIGPDYIEIALKAAREADPGAKLFLNDFDAEGLNAKSDALYEFVKDLKRRGVPIDAVGLQMHIKLDGPPSMQGLRANIRRLAELGLDIYITEMDVRIKTPVTKEDLRRQATRYREVFEVCLSEPNCKALFTWGFTDKYSWIPKQFPEYDAALIFDDNYKPKPAYHEIFEALAK